MKQIKVNLDELVTAHEEMSDGFFDSFLDLETGEVVMESEDDKMTLRDFEEADGSMSFEEWLDQCGCPDWQRDSIVKAHEVDEGFGKRFIRIPGVESREGYGDMEAFVETVSDARLREMLELAINGKGAFRRFKDVLCRDEDEEKRWFEFKYERSKERVLEWLQEEGIEPISG